MLLGIGIVGILTGADTGELAPDLLSRWGFALHDFWEGGWYSIITSVFFTKRPLMFWGMFLVFVSLTIGVYEWLAGTRKALVMYWLTNISGYLLVTLGIVLPLYLARTSLGLDLAYADDVGMSGGGMGCLGAWFRRLPQSWRYPMLGIATAALLIHLMMFTDAQADLLHLVTFFGGFWLDGILVQQPKSNS